MNAPVLPTAEVLTSVEEVRAAAQRLKGIVKRTPILTNADLDRRAGGRVLLKPEPLQITGSFKFRGAYNRLVQLNSDQRKAGVVAMSSGNHAQGVAMAAQMLGMPAVIVMPEDSPQLKLDRTLACGAEVVTFNRDRDDRVAMARDLAEKRGAVLVPPYDDVHIIAGQGTAGLELMEDAAALGLLPDQVLACASGGGLMAGVGLAVRSFNPQAQIYSVEPEGFDDHARSFASGGREKNAILSGSLCDGLLSPMPGEITFPINTSIGGKGLVVSEAEVKAAMVYAFIELKIVLEPSGAVGLAAVLAGKAPTKGRVTGVILSGGNVDPALFAQILAGR